MRVNLGAGAEPRPGWVNLDAVAMPGIDVVHDLDVAPWPFKDGEVAEVWAFDIFEHVNDPILFVTELHRILAPGGLVNIRTPHWQCQDAFTDPTHKRFPTPMTFDYWIPGRYLYKHNQAYGGVDFDMPQWWIQEGQLRFQLRKPA